MSSSPHPSAAPTTSARYPFTVIVNNPLPMSPPFLPHLPPDAEMATTVRVPGAQQGQPPLAQIFVARDTRQWSRHSPVPFWILTGPDHGSVSSVRPSAQGDPGGYDVHAPDGTLLAQITRRPGRLLPWPRRIRWSARLDNPAWVCTGKVGTWYSWLCYVVTSPLWLSFSFALFLYSLFDGTTSDSSFDSPSRTRWRTRGAGKALDRRGFPKTYHLDTGRLDPRVAYAMAVLQTWERT
ncbi:hypothetical protein ABZ027_08720 [Streptomyces sp. NPDC006332]|uniref:hypothetical protein n=1 Tax=Streptomyces sp. NPDC006332 TaxID=3155456 RepID=UPI00339F0EFA